MTERPPPALENPDLQNGNLRRSPISGISKSFWIWISALFYIFYIFGFGFFIEEFCVESSIG